MIHIFIPLLSIISIAHLFAQEKPYCANPKAGVLPPVLEILDLAMQEQETASVLKENIVERDLVVDGVAVIAGKPLISIKVRTPGSTEIIGKILLSPGQSYRGVEAIKAALKARSATMPRFV